MQIPNKIGEIHRDKFGRPVPVAPAVSQAVVSNDSFSSGDLFTNLDDTNSHASIIRIFSDTELYLRFKSANQTSDASSSEFDEYVPANIMIDVGIPAYLIVNDVREAVTAVHVAGSGSVRAILK